MRRQLFLIVTAVYVLSCGEDAMPTGPGPSSPQPSAPAVTVVEVTPAADTLVTLGASVQLTAEVRDQNGNVMAGVGVGWTSSNGTIVSVDSTGLATAVDGGTAIISATASGVSGTADLAVFQVATDLGFSVQPTTVAGNEPLAAVEVEFLDSGGSRVGGGTGAITLSLLNEPTRNTLGGTLTVNAVDGVATFDDLRVDNPGRLVLVAEVAGLSPVESDPFDVELTFASLSAGGYHSCGVTVPGHAYCWGHNADGQLGDQTTWEAMYPVLVTGGIGFVRVAAAARSSCGVATDGTAYCWGDNTLGQLGDGTNTAAAAPVAVSGGLLWTSLTIGNLHVCGIATDGNAYCWGWNASGQLGDGTTTSQASPVLVAGGHSFASLTAGSNHTCGLTALGEVYCWGDNGSGQLGIGSSGHPTTPTLVSGHTFAAVQAYGLTTCAMDVANAAWCWGDNSRGGVGDGTTVNRTAPVAVGGSTTFQSVNAGTLRSCGLDVAGMAYCWGDNEYGMLGDGNAPTDSFTPVAVAGGHAFVQLTAGNRHACGLQGDGSVYCWGRNANAQLGSGDKVDGLAPVRIVQ